MLLYRLFKYPVQLALTFFYKRIYLLGLDNLPHNKATIVAANHPNTFIDPILIASMQPYDLYFWARANEFKKPLIGWVARNVHMLPIHRMRDGKDGMQKNNQTFEVSKVVLNDKKILFIAPEGDCEVEKRLRLLKQGTAKLALEYANDYPDKPLYIVPVGLNYTTITQGWGDVMMVCGTPIEVQRYLPDYKEDNYRAIELLTADMRQGMIDSMLHIDKPENEKMVEGLWEMHRNDNYSAHFPPYIYKSPRFQAEQRLARAAQSGDEAEVEARRQAVAAYIDGLAERDLHDFGIAQRDALGWGRAFFVLLGAPLALVGLATLPPLALVKFMLKKYIKDVSFRAPMALVFGIIFYGLWSLIGVVAALFFVPWYTALLVPFGVLGLQYFSQHWDDQAQRLKRLQAWRRFARAQPDAAAQIIAQREQIWKMIP